MKNITIYLTLRDILVSDEIENSFLFRQVPKFQQAKFKILPNVQKTTEQVSQIISSNSENYISKIQRADKHCCQMEIRF